MSKWKASLALLVLSNVLVGIAVILQTLAPYIRLDILILIGADFAVIGVILAVIQGLVATNEQKQELEEQVKKERINREKEFKFLYNTSLALTAVVFGLAVLLRFTVYKDLNK